MFSRVFALLCNELEVTCYISFLPVAIFTLFTPILFFIRQRGRPCAEAPWTTPHCFMSAFPHSFKASSVLGCPRPSSLNCLYCRGHFPPSLVHKDLLAFRKRLMTASLADALPCNSFACASPSSLARFLPAGNIRLPLPLRSALCRRLVIQR